MSTIFVQMIFLITSILKPLHLLKSCPIYDEAAKLCKASKDAYNQERWLILEERLIERVAEGVASEVHDFTLYIVLVQSIPSWLVWAEIELDYLFT